MSKVITKKKSKAPKAKAPAKSKKPVKKVAKKGVKPAKKAKPVKVKAAKKVKAPKPGKVLLKREKLAPPPKKTMTRERKQLEHKVAQIMTKGRDRGFVTYDEILRVFPEIENNVDFLEELYDRLGDTENLPNRGVI